MNNSSQAQSHINIAFPRPKKAKTQVINRHNANLKMDKPVSNNISQLINNFIIYKQIPLKPNNLKYLFTDRTNNDETVSIASVGGKQVVIIFLKYIGFCPNISGSKTEKRKITSDIISNNPSYLCLFDFATCHVLDVVQVPGEIKQINLFRQFTAITYSTEFGSKQNNLITFTVSPIIHKFTQIHPQMDIGSNKIDKISMNYINLAEKNSGGVDTNTDGRLIIYCCTSTRYKNDLLITFDYSIYQDCWILHKMSAVSGMAVDITKYTQTDYFAGIVIDIDTENIENRIINNRIVALHMDDTDLNNPVSEIYRQKHEPTWLCTNDYILHPDGRLELVNFDIGRALLKSIKFYWRQLEKIICQYNYPQNKGGIEIIYSTILETPQPPSQELVYGDCIFTVKNGVQEYQLQPGLIMKYACMKYIHRQNAQYLYTQPTLRATEINIGGTCKFIYSPDGKYLAQIIECNLTNNFYGKLQGVLLYTKSYHMTTRQTGGMNTGIWRECSFINVKSKQKRVNFIPATNYDGALVGYNLMITTDYQDKYKDYTIIHTPQVLADKYYVALSKINTQLCINNICNISRFIAAAKLRYVDLSNNSPNNSANYFNSSSVARRDNMIKTGYKSSSAKMDI